MYYVDNLEMIASCLKPSLNSFNGVGKLRNHKRSSFQKKNQNLIKPLSVSICFLFCIVLAPQNHSKTASICEKYNSTVACQVW